MSRFFLAIQVWWRTLVDAEFGRQVAQLLAGEPAPALPAASIPAATKVDQAGQKMPQSQPVNQPRASQRSAALTLLATLQREARLVDFLKESIGEYSDAQIGAAVRDVHRDAAAVLDRLFKIRPIEAHEEGAEVQAPAEADRYRLIGTVRGRRRIEAGWSTMAGRRPSVKSPNGRETPSRRR